MHHGIIVHSQYITVIFHRITLERHPIARPQGRGIGCPSWVQIWPKVLSLYLLCCVHYRIIYNNEISRVYSNSFNSRTLKLQSRSAHIQHHSERWSPHRMLLNVRWCLVRYKINMSCKSCVNKRGIFFSWRDFHGHWKRFLYILPNQFIHRAVQAMTWKLINALARNSWRLD